MKVARICLQIIYEQLAILNREYDVGFRINQDLEIGNRVLAENHNFRWFSDNEVAEEVASVRIKDRRAIRNSDLVC